MSAIAGILRFDGAAVEPDRIASLTAAMKHRGPDAQTHWRKGPVALGHCMLRTTPESLEEHQPLASPDGKRVLVWDGRLDNREALQQALASAGIGLRDDSDAELALQSYLHWGEDCPQQLLGDFAFAVWDADRGTLFCARDHLGARPFFYFLDDRCFAFASEEEALLELPGVSRRPNKELVAYYLVPGFTNFDPAHSWLDEVWALLPAQSMTVSSKRKLKRGSYWKPQLVESPGYASDEECWQAFLQVFGEAVRCRLRSRDDIALMLSGGLDSAAIVAMARRQLAGMAGKALHSYSAISDQPESCVESRCILSLAEGMEGAHFVSVPSLTGMLNLQDLLETAWSRPHPVDNSIPLPAMMCRAAARDGRRVMLHGVCGDLTLYLPHRYIAWLLRAGNWRRAWRECRGASRHNTYMRGTSPYLLLLGNLWFAYGPRPLRRWVRGLRARLAGSPVERSLIEPGFAESLGLAESLHANAKAGTDYCSDIRVLHLQALSPPHGIASSLSGYDRVAGHYGVELRDPWADRRVVEFFLNLPLEYKIRDGWTKYPVRAAFAAELAEEVRWRPGKEHLGWELICRLLDESRARIEEARENALGILGSHVDPDALRRLFVKYFDGGGDDVREGIYEIMSLAFWLSRTGGGRQDES